METAALSMPFLLIAQLVVSYYRTSYAQGHCLPRVPKSHGPGLDESSSQVNLDLSVTILKILGTIAASKHHSQFELGKG